MARKIGIDLGTTNLLICVDNKGVVVNEPSIITVDAQSKKCIAAGLDAKDMLGRTPKNMICLRPLKDGVVADFEATDMMLNYFLKKCDLKGMFQKNVILICHPTKITSVEKNAIRDCAYRAGAKKVFMEEEPKVAALGAGLDIGKASGHMVLDIGGGTSDIAILSLGDIVSSQSIRMAGDKMNSDIASYIKNKHGLVIGEHTAEKIKMELGTALRADDPETMDVRGRDVATGMPKQITVNENEIEEALHDTLEQIVSAAVNVLETIPPELASDIIDRGIMLTGGTSLLKGVDQLFSARLKVPVVVSQDPLDNVAKGAGEMLERMQKTERKK